MALRRHRPGSLVFGVVVGLIVAVVAYRWATDPAPRLEREQQEAAVIAARSLLGATLGLDTAEIVDPLLPDRKVGRTYVYRDGPGWQVSGYYRRGPDDLWHPYLVDLSADFLLLRVKVSDPALLDRNGEPGLEVLP